MPVEERETKPNSSARQHITLLPSNFILESNVWGEKKKKSTRKLSYLLWTSSWIWSVFIIHSMFQTAPIWTGSNSTSSGISLVRIFSTCQSSYFQTFLWIKKKTKYRNCSYAQNVSTWLLFYKVTQITKEIGFHNKRTYEAEEEVMRFSNYISALSMGKILYNKTGNINILAFFLCLKISIPAQLRY